MLREYILQKLDHERIEQKKLAQVAEVAPSKISRYLNGHIEINFEAALKIVKYLFPEQEVAYMAEYARTQEKQNARYCLEYSIIHRLRDVTTHLVEKLGASSNIVDREWSKMYHFILGYTKKINHEDLIQELEQFLPHTIEMQILKKIVLGNIYADRNNHIVVFDYVYKLEMDIEIIHSHFIRDCFNIRLGLLMNHITLYQNKVEQARYYSLCVLNQWVANHVKAAAYHTLGHSYLYENYEQALEYLEKAIQMFKDANRDDLAQLAARTLSFIQSYWKIERELPFELEGFQDKAEYIYYLIQKEDMDQAKEVMLDIHEASISDLDKAFYYYYAGIIEQDKSKLLLSVKWFRKTRDFFHLQLPIKALHKMGENPIVLEILSSSE